VRARWVRVALVAVAVGAALAAWGALAPLPSGSRELTFVVPRGTAARQAAGAPSAMPSVLRFTVGVRDTLVLKNEDDVPATFGPVLLAPGQTYRVPFRSPAEFQMGCSLHGDGRVTIVVVPAPARGWARLRWRLAELTGW